MISFEHFQSLIKLYIPNNFRFKCFDCGDCCRYEAGYIFLLDNEINLISKSLNINKEEFLRNFTFKFSNSVHSLKEKENLDCVFWDNSIRNGKGGCSIYKIRPVQCKDFPFWISTLSSKQNFEEQANRCKGIMAKDGKLYSSKEVYKLVYMDIKKRETQYKSFLDDETIKILYY
ncbi:MAG: YkgJ family cysteine cluster protein [Exilispira sp.]|jgi:Fe-S-cluster containining protein|nr:YkgJ family cysteine cluster protein [Exilispira sp.]